MLRRLLPPLVLSLILATFLLFPVLGDPSGRLIGDAAVDGFGSYWFQWWVGRALSDGTSLAHTDLLFYPWGKDILRHTGANLLDVLLLLPIRAWLGPGIAWNFLVFMALFGNGAAAGAWATRRGVATPGVLAATAIAVLHPYPLHEIAMGRPTQAILAPLILSLAATEAAFAERSRRAAVVAGAFLALSGWFYWYYGVFGAIGGCLLGAGRPRNLGLLVVVAVVALVLVLPGIAPLVAALGDGSVPNVLPGDLLRGASQFANLEGSAVRLSVLREDGYATFIDGKSLAPEGMILGVFAALPLFFNRGTWMGVVIAATFLAWGPFLGDVANPAYLLFSLFPPAARLYWPSRFVALLVVGAVAGILQFSARATARVQAGLLVAVLLGMATEAWHRGALPLHTWSAEVSPAWSCVDGGAVLELPYGVDQWPLVEQTVHGQAMFGGMHERSRSLVPMEQQAFRKSNTWLAAVLMAVRNPREEMSWDPADREAMGAMGYRFVVVRLDVLERDPELLRVAMRRFPALLGPQVEGTQKTRIFMPWGGSMNCSKSWQDSIPNR